MKNTPCAPEDSSSIQISFSHIHLYVDSLENVEAYKDYELILNEGHAKQDNSSPSPSFVPQNRDVVNQLLAGLGFRVTGYRYPTTSIDQETTTTNTRSVLVTSRDPEGVQIVVTAIDPANTTTTNTITDPYNHFDAENLREFYKAHKGRQGFAVLAFLVNDTNSMESIHARYKERHPALLKTKEIITYSGSHDNDVIVATKVLEVYAYYKGQSAESNPSLADMGTVLRFVQQQRQDQQQQQSHMGCPLPGLKPLQATFDNSNNNTLLGSKSQPAYFDHWVSNVFDRNQFLDTLQDTLGFTPKVDFNAGVIAAGEAQIESTVTGNHSTLITLNKDVALKDQSQVYLPINNALTSVGHVHGFLNEIGQGIQHIACRVENLVDFVQRANDSRKLTGEGFTFLRIPRSYYGVLTRKQIVDGLNNNGKLEGDSSNKEQFADLLMELCDGGNIISMEDGGAVNLYLSRNDIDNILEKQFHSVTNSNCSESDEKKSQQHMLETYQSSKDTILDIILRSRYCNLYNLLGEHLNGETYLGIVRNQILVDVQGDDLLFQIFTSNIMQRKAGEEAPFFEFIQRVCSVGCCDNNGNNNNGTCQKDMNEVPEENKEGEEKLEVEAVCAPKDKTLKPGCGGFGIRNFLTLFLSIEVSKAMQDALEAKKTGNEQREKYANKMVDCFTCQLNESNPILTEISNAMTEEGHCKQKLEDATSPEDISHWTEKKRQESNRKHVYNQKLMECSARYSNLMKSIREEAKEEANR